MNNRKYENIEELDWYKQQGAEWDALIAEGRHFMGGRGSSNNVVLLMTKNRINISIDIPLEDARQVHTKMIKTAKAIAEVYK